MVRDLISSRSLVVHGPFSPFVEGCSCRIDARSLAAPARGPLRWIAFSTHPETGCTHAPLPGSRAAVSTTTRPSRATTLTSEERGARCRQPRQVLTGSIVPLTAECRRQLLHDGVGLDVDPRARELGGEAGVLALLADRERELVVGHEGAHGLERLVDDERARDLRRATGRSRRRWRDPRRSRRCRSSRRSARRSRRGRAARARRCRRPWR